jgi:hypothetical protein
LDLAAWQLQAGWLADSGLQRAVHRLQATSDYPGETWEVPAASLASGRGTSVVIHVQPLPPETPGWHVRVEARYPGKGAQGVLSVRDASIAAPGAAPEDSAS